MFEIPKTTVTTPLVSGRATPVHAPLLPLRAFIIRATFSFMFTAFLLSASAFVSHVHAGNTHSSYIAALSVVITLVAAYHYHEILAVRTHGTGMTFAQTEVVVDGLRHSDWLVTLPVLVLKLYSLIGNSKDAFFVKDNVELSALLAMLMVLLGGFATLGLQGNVVWQVGYNGAQTVIHIVLYAASWLILAGLLVDLESVHSASNAEGVIRSFYWVWIGYGIISTGSALAKKTRYTEELSIFKDVGYALLDLWSKAIFAWYTASLAYDVKVF